MARNPTQITPVILQGGLNLAAPPISAQSGEAQVLHNYVCDTMGRYERIKGFCRVDGQQDPVEAKFTVLRFKTVPSEVLSESLLGKRIETKGPDIASGTLVHFYKDEFVLVEVDGTFKRGDTLVLATGETAVVQAVYQGSSGYHISNTQQYRHEVRGYFRNRINAVPGSGPIRGVAYFNDELLAWRDDVNGHEVHMWRATDVGWTQVKVVPPRLYEPPFEYHYLLYSGQSGVSPCSAPEEDQAALSQTFTRGYFLHTTRYGDLLLPRPGPEAEAVESIRYWHPGPDVTQLELRVGENLGDFGSIEVYVEDIPMYRFMWHDADPTLHDPVPFRISDEPENGVYTVLIPECVELWGPRQRVGFMFRPQSDVPAPDPDPNVWTVNAPASVVEGETLDIIFHAETPQGQPAVGARLEWEVEGIEAGDVTSGGFSGTASTDSNGEIKLSWDLLADGIPEGEALRIRGLTNDGNELEVTVDILDEELPEGTHTYTLQGPTSLEGGKSGVFTISVVNREGYPVEGQAITWALQNAPHGAFNTPTQSTAYTDASGKIQVTVSAKIPAQQYDFNFVVTAPTSKSRSCKVTVPYVAEAPPPTNVTPSDGAFWITAAMSSEEASHVFQGAPTLVFGWNTYTGHGAPRYGSPTTAKTYADFSIRGIAAIDSVDGDSGIHIVLGRTATNRLSSVSVQIRIEYVDSPSSRKHLATVTSTPSNSSFSSDGQYRFTWIRYPKSSVPHPLTSKWRTATGKTYIQVSV